MTDSSAAGPERGEEVGWLRTWAWPIAVTVLALALRLAVLAQTHDLPFFSAPIGDARAYVAWAERISGGDVLGRAEGVFYQAPLYPYLIALARLVSGADGALLTLRLAQMVLAALACGLLVVVGRRAAGTAAGVAAGLLLAGYAPAIVFDVQLGKESFALALGVLLLALLTAVARAPRSPLVLGAGCVLGAIVLLRESALLLAAAGGLWIAFGLGGRSHALRARWILAWSAGLGFVLLPVALRNWAVGGDLALTTAQAGPNFYIGNHSGATGSYLPLRPGRGDAQFERQDAVDLAQQASGRTLSAREVSAFWFARGYAFWRAEPGAAVRLLGRKLRLATQAEEIPDTEADWIYRRSSWGLALLGVVGNFGVLLPLAVVGLLLRPGPEDSTPRLRWLLAGWILTGLAGLVAFYVLGRYRALLLPPLMLLAGAGVSGLVALVRQRIPLRRQRALGALAGGVAVAILIHLPGVAAPARGLAEANLALAYALTGRPSEAEAAYQRALATDPEIFEARLGLGNLLLVQGRPKEALPHLEAAVALVPGDSDALEQRRIALQLDSASDDARQNHANFLRRGGDCAAAEKEYSELFERNPGRSAAAAGLAACQARRKDYSGSLEAVARGREAAPGNGNLILARARLLAASPDPRLRNGAEALALARAVVAVSRTTLALETAAMALAETGDFPAAIEQQQEALAAAQAFALSSRTRDRLESGLESYRRAEPCRDPALD